LQKVVLVDRRWAPAVHSLPSKKACRKSILPWGVHFLFPQRSGKNISFITVREILDEHHVQKI